MLKAILIIFFMTGTYGGGVAVEEVEFDSLQSCEQARIELPLFNKLKVRSVCVEK